MRKLDICYSPFFRNTITAFLNMIYNHFFNFDLFINKANNRKMYKQSQPYNIHNIMNISLRYLNFHRCMLY